MTESATMSFNCINPECNNKFTARIIEHMGGMNDYGSWIVKCKKCSEIFDVYIGRDVNDSSLASGGQILGKYLEEVYSHQQIDDEVKKFKAKK